MFENFQFKLMILFLARKERLRKEFLFKFISSNETSRRAASGPEVQAEKEKLVKPDACYSCKHFLVYREDRR